MARKERKVMNREKKPEWVMGLGFGVEERLNFELEWRPLLLLLAPCIKITSSPGRVFTEHEQNSDVTKNSFSFLKIQNFGTLNLV